MSDSQLPTLEKLFYRAKDIVFITGISRTALYGYMKKGLFPKPIKFGFLSLWKKKEVDAFIAELEKGEKK